MEPVRQAYGVLAERYIELFGHVDQVHADDLDLIARHLIAGHGAVADVGCGPGHLTAYLRSLDVEATGIDIVPDFVDHARRTDPGGRYEIGSIERLPVPDHSIAGILAWYSLIHVPPDDVDGVLAELRRAMAPSGVLVVGFFDGDVVEAFEHKVVTAYRWPVDELSVRLRRAGFTEIERQQRPGETAPGPRPHAAIAAVAT
jgi:SAM-dependent methyltransferase